MRMLMDKALWFVTRHPRWVVLGWVVVTALVIAVAPDLTRLAAEGQAKLVPENSESAMSANLVRAAFPDQAYDSAAAAVLNREGGLTEADRAFARSLESTLEGPRRPANLLRVLGPSERPEIAEYLSSADGTTQLVVAQFGSSFVAPVTLDAVKSLQELTSELATPAGLKIVWTGDAVFGSDYMDSVKTSLDRAAVVTVLLILLVLLSVYRSPLLALVPLVTIGIGLMISRGVLAWMTQAGWDMSPLVELFLVVILFGCGTDFCLLVSWRFGEHWNPTNPAGAMRTTLRLVTPTLLSSAGTVIAGLSLMGLTRFKLFSSTGPSVALGLALTLTTVLTLTPALLVLLATYRPRAFAGLTAPSSGFWDRVGRRVLARPWIVWGGTLLLMAVPSIIGFNPSFTQDLVADLPRNTKSVDGMRIISDKFGAGRVAPLTIVLKANENFREAEGLALIDDVSRLLSRQRRLLEVRSATQPLGSTEPLEPARLDARLRTITDGFGSMVEGAEQLREGLTEGAAKLQTAILLEEMTGIPLTGSPPPQSTSTRDALVSGLRQATGSIFGGRPTAPPAPETGPEPPPASDPPAEPKAEAPQERMLRDLTRAADGARQIAEGAGRAREEIEVILRNDVGRKALDRLLITPQNVEENPDLQEALDVYISPDGELARIDLVQADRLFSEEALDQVQSLRRQLRDWLGEIGPGALDHPGVAITGPNAESADIRELTRTDQYQSWVVVPLGVFLVLLLTLRDPLACLNLVATMVVTYLFALGVAHVVFVWGLGAEGLDWKVPYFLFVLLIAVGVDYNVFLMTRLQEETRALGQRAGITRAVAQTGGLISSAAAITACSFSAFMFSPLSSLRQLGFALVVGIVVDAVLVRPILVPCGQWLMNRGRDRRDARARSKPNFSSLSRVAD